MLKVGEISFVNYIPLSSKNADYPFPCKFVRAVPSELNAACRRGELDISPISFFAYSDLRKRYKILPNFCIASDGEVMSVKLFSHFPIENLRGKKIFFTGESESSVNAFRAICKKEYAFDPKDFASPDSSSADALILIGDKALKFSKTYKYVYDIGSLWQRAFQLPIVFSVIIVKNEIFDAVKEKLLIHYENNLADFYKDENKYCSLASEKLASENFTASDAKKYYSKLIFKISDEAMERSLNILNGTFA